LKLSDSLPTVPIEFELCIADVLESFFAHFKRRRVEPDLEEVASHSHKRHSVGGLVVQFLKVSLVHLELRALIHPDIIFNDTLEAL